MLQGADQGSDSSWNITKEVLRVSVLKYYILDLLVGVVSLHASYFLILSALGFGGKARVP